MQTSPKSDVIIRFFVSPDTSAMAWILIALQENAFLSNHLLYKYDEWYNKIVERILRGQGQ